MAKWLVTLDDGRTVEAHAPTEAAAIAHGTHADKTRDELLRKRGKEMREHPRPAAGKSAVRLKD